MPDALRIKFQACLTAQGEAVENGELLISGGRILEIFRRQTASPDMKYLDLSDHLILPGFVNAHCHLSLSALQGRVPRCDEFTDWVRALLKENFQISWDERVRAMQAGSKEMLRSGVTTLADYLSQPELLPEYTALPFRQVLFFEVLGFKASRVDETLDRVKSIFESQNPKGEMMKLGLAPHAPYSVSPALFRALKQLASRTGCPHSCHLAEFPEEIRFLKEGGGKLQKFLEERDVYDDDWVAPGLSPVRYLDQMGVLDSMVAVHLNHIGEDLELLAAKKVKAVFCPGSTRWFDRTRFMPVRKLLDAGITVALGTDSLASNHSLNFLSELRAADAMLPDVSRPEILKMATSNGGQALGFAKGTIAPGEWADLIGFRVNKKPRSWTDVPFEPQRDQVDFSMIAGDVVTTI